MNHERTTDSGNGADHPNPRPRTNQQHGASNDEPGDTQINPTRSPISAQSLLSTTLGVTQQNPPPLQQFAQFQQPPSTSLQSFSHNSNVANQGFQQQLASYMTFQQQLPSQFPPAQAIGGPNLSMTMMGQQPSAGMGSFLSPSSLLGGGLQSPSFGPPLPFAMANTATRAALGNTATPAALGYSIFPCKSRGMTKDHNAQVSTGICVDVFRDVFPFDVFFLFWGVKRILFLD